MIKRLLLILSILLLLASQGWATTRNASTFAELQTAITASSSGDIILLADSTYTISADISTGNKGLTIQGANSDATKVIFDFAAGEKKIDLSGANDSGTSFKYITFKNWNCAVANSTGLIKITAGGGTVDNCIFSNNASSTTTSGIIYINAASISPTISNCSFTDNSLTGQYNSLIYISAPSDTTGLISLSNLTIGTSGHGNTITMGGVSGGGLVGVFGNAAASISNLKCAYNNITGYANLYDVLINTSNTNNPTTVTNTEISNETLVASYSRAVCISTDGCPAGTVTFSNLKIHNNACTSLSATPMQLSLASNGVPSTAVVSVNDSEIYNNTTTATANDGSGGIMVYRLGGGTCSLNRVSVHDNTHTEDYSGSITHGNSVHGGGLTVIAGDDGDTLLTCNYCKFTDNTCTGGKPVGGGNTEDWTGAGNVAIAAFYPGDNVALNLKGCTISGGSVAAEVTNGVTRCAKEFYSSWHTGSGTNVTTMLNTIIPNSNTFPVSLDYETGTAVTATYSCLDLGAATNLSNTTTPTSAGSMPTLVTDGSYPIYQVRNNINPSNDTNLNGVIGNRVRIKIQANNAHNSVIGGTSVGLKSANWNFAATPVRITWSGNNGITIPAGTTSDWSDWAPISWNYRQSYLIHINYYNGGSTVYDREKSGLASSVNSYYTTTRSADDTLTMSIASGYGGPIHEIDGLASIQVASAADPLFRSVSGKDYHLQATSPCINTGTTIAGQTKDLAGIPVPMGSGWDIGAYEFFSGGGLSPGLGLFGGNHRPRPQ